MHEINRRHFLTTAATGGAVLASRGARAVPSTSDTVALAIMGTNGRGCDLARGFAKQAGVEIAYICDCDERAIQKGIAAALSSFSPHTFW